jgi:DNA-3-methyladenine glycosylase II
MSPLPPRLTRATLLAGARRLARGDRRLARLLQLHGPPPLWSRPQGFGTLLRIILEQQVSLASAQALFVRLAAGGPVSPERVAALGPRGLGALGFTRQKAACVYGLALGVLERRWRLDRLPRLPDAEVCAELGRIPGVGPWTANIYLLMALRRPDVWPHGDLALHHAMARLDGAGVRPTARAASEQAERWRPLRAVAARMLWQSYLAERRSGA